MCQDLCIEAAPVVHFDEQLYILWESEMSLKTLAATKDCAAIFIRNKCGLNKMHCSHLLQEKYFGFRTFCFRIILLLPATETPSLFTVFFSEWFSLPYNSSNDR